jgi:hypothetical protein
VPPVYRRGLCVVESGLVREMNVDEVIDKYMVV